MNVMQVFCLQRTTDCGNGSHVQSKKEARSIGQLDAEFQPTQKKMSQVKVGSSIPTSNSSSKSVYPNDAEYVFILGGWKNILIS